MDSFDEQTVIVFTDMGELTVKGEGLHINRLSLEVGGNYDRGKHQLSLIFRQQADAGGRILEQGVPLMDYIVGMPRQTTNFFAVARLWILYRRIV